MGEPAVEGGGNGTNSVLEEGQSFFDFGGVEGRATHQDVRVPIDVLRDGVYNNIRTMIERILHIRT